MSLLKKASIITTPTAYAEDYLYSIKPAYALGENLNVLPSSDSAVGNHYKFSPYGNNTVQYVNGETIITHVDNTSGAFHYFRTSYNTTSILTVNKKYKVEISFKVNTGSFTWQYNAGVGGTLSLDESSNTEFETIGYSFIAGHATNTFIRTAGMGSGQVVTVKKITIQEITDADFDFDRNSIGTRVNEDYLIEDVPYNLITRSEDFSNAAYTKYNASIAETTIQSPISGSYVESISNTNTGTTYSFISQNLAAPDREVNITLSVYAKKGTYNRLGISSRSGDTFGAIYDLENGTVVDTHPNTGHILASSIQSAGNDFYLCSITVVKSVQYNIHPLPSNASTASLLLGNLSYTETGNVNIFGAQAVKGSDLKPYLKTTDRLDIPRIDYTNGEGSILLEPQRTNTVQYSQDFSQYNSGGGLTLTTGFLAPDGTNSATKITATIGTSSLYRSGESSTTASRTIWARTVSGTGQAVLLSYFGNTNNAFTITEKWQRFEVNSAVATGGTNFYAIDFRNGFANSLSEIIIWGAQSEEATYATSLIHTSGSAVTRSADAANNAGNSDLFNDSEGVLYCEIKATANDLSQRRITISDGSLNNRIGIEYTSSSNQIRGRVTDGGSGQADMTYTAIDITEYIKIAVKYKVNDCALYVNGQEVVVDTSATMPSGLDKLSFDQATSVLNYYGNVKSVMVFKEALTDLELEKLTGYNNHELYMNYYNRLSYLGLVEEYNVESDINNYIL